MTFSVGQRAIVVDASVAVRFLLGDADWEAAWRRWSIAEGLIVVPPHFSHEVANALLRSARIGALETVAAVGRLFRVGFEVADRGLTGLVSSTRLAEQHRLTVYDAAYLDLAVDIDGDLATLDVPLRAAAEAEGVTVVG